MKQKTIELVNFLHHLVIKKKLLKSNQSIILAISGGQDSITLLFIFIQLKNQWNWKLNIIYCNHLWQKDSFYTMLHLFKLAYLLNLPIYLAVTLQKVLTEQKARIWRSLTFQRITVFYILRVIITGHSKSDRIETGFFNLFRGSGTKGISSLNWTKVKIKNYNFKLNKTQFPFLKQISMQSKTKRKFLVRSKPIYPELLEKSYKAEKKTFIQLDLLKPIVSKINLINNQKTSINSLKLNKLNKYGIKNVIKKFYIYRVGVHFKCNLKNRQNKNKFILKKEIPRRIFYFKRQKRDTTY